MRNYKNKSAYGYAVRFLTEALELVKYVATCAGVAAAVALLVAVAFLFGCGTPSGAAGTPDSASVDVVGGSTDTSLPENDASNTDTVPVDNGSDATTDTADSGSPDVSGDSATDAGDTVAPGCPTPDHPDRPVEVTIGSEVECVASTVWKTCLDVLPGNWNKTEQDGDACDHVTITMLPSSFQPDNMGWAELPGKPAEYAGLPIIAFKCEGFSKTRYYALQSCVGTNCEAVMPDWKAQDFGSKLSVSLVTQATVTETEWAASTKEVDATRVFQK